MKPLKNLFAVIELMAIVVILALFAPRASAQFNVFAENRTIVVTPPQMIDASASNYIADIQGFEGVGTLTFISPTNVSTNVTVVSVSSSPDRTNWTALPFAYVTSNSVITTNLYYGTGTPLATNWFLWPGTVTTPTAATAGFVTRYTLPGPMTNTGNITVGGPLVTNKGVTMIGFNCQDSGRYINVAWTIAGTSTNCVAALFTGRRQQNFNQ